MAKNTIVKNTFGVELVFETISYMMDDDLREELHSRLAPCTEQEFMTAYCEAHEKKFGELWALDDPNPMY